MSVGFDFGTSNIVAARKDEDGKTILSVEKNCFFDVGTDFEEMLEGSGFTYIKESENGEDRLFVVGMDALKLANLYSSNEKSGVRTSGLRRPMANMVINSKTDKKAIQMLKHMSQSLIGKPKYVGEVAVISVPADPLSGEFNNVFHSNMCQNFIRELGYDVVPINESLSVVYATNPTAKSEDGEELSMTGIGISFGGGGVNGCFSYRGKDTIRFSLDRSGDWIDGQVASISNMSRSEVTVAKENLSKAGTFDLSSPCYDDDVTSGLYIYYKNLVDTVVKQFRDEFLEKGTQFTDAIEVVVSGGTSKPKGFEKMVEQAIAEIGWPFEIKGVRRAKDALSATAVGCLAAATSREKKNKH